MILKRISILNYKKLEQVEKDGIQVVVIPGNHDINNRNAASFDGRSRQMAEAVSANEFAEIYNDFGYDEALSRDPASLSYTYDLGPDMRLLMLDSCQYSPTNKVGGMIKTETYDWIDDQLDEAWDDGVILLPVAHHNLLDESGVSRSFYDNCTIEHNEELVRMLSDHGVRLHLSGHLHIQHYKEDEDTGIYEIALVDVLRQLAGIAVYEPVNLFVVHGIDTPFLLFPEGIGLIHHFTISGGSGAGNIVGKAVGVFSTPGGLLIDGVIFRHNSSSQKAGTSGQIVPKSRCMDVDSIGANGARP